jgi:type VI secretion system secreted protein VgrG
MTVEVDNNETDYVDNDQTIMIGNNRTEVVQKGNDKITIQQGNRAITISMGSQTTEAMQSIELKVGQSSVKLDQTGVTIKGLMIQIEGMTQAQVKGDAMLTLQGGIVMIN